MSEVRTTSLVADTVAQVLCDLGPVAIIRDRYTGAEAGIHMAQVIAIQGIAPIAAR